MHNKRTNILFALFLFALTCAVFVPLINMTIVIPHMEGAVATNEEHHSVLMARHIVEMFGADTLLKGSEEEVQAKIGQIISGQEIVKLRIFNADGVILRSTEPSEVGQLNTHDYYLEKVANGKVFSKLVSKDGKTLEGKRQSIDVMETYFPIMENGKFRGAIEIYHDISGSIGQLNRLVTRISLLIILASLVMAGFLLVVYKRTRREDIEHDETQDSLSRALKSIADEKAKTESIIGAMGDGISIQDTNFKIIYQNKKHSDLIGEHLGEYCYQAYEDSDTVCQGCPLALSMKDGKVHTAERITPDGKLHVEITASPLKDAEGNILAGIESVRDITKRKLLERELIKRRDSLSREVTVKNDTLEEYAIQLLQTDAELRNSLDEKEMLLKEVHHRVKNNMQVISSLLSLQSYDSKDASTRVAFDESIGRIKSMALVHEKLYQSEDFSNIDINNYIKDLADIHQGEGVIFRSEVDSEPLGIDTAIPCGLIINELFSNAVKHAFNGNGGGEVVVGFNKNAEGRCTLRVGDNGCGISKLQSVDDISSERSLGLFIVKLLVEQLEGDMQINADSGTEFKIKFNV